MSENLFDWSAEHLARAISTREISSREAVISCLGRIHELNPKVNALAEVLTDTALQAADIADKAVASGEPLGALHGVPITTKINVDQQGCATSNGVRAFANLMATQDNPAVANLRSAGAVPIGRSNTPAFSFRWFTSNDLFGTTINPLNPALTPGGSSGGAAVAVACGMGPIAHGNDMAGSIRYPASVCGVYGLRPSLGRVPSFNLTAKDERSPAAQLSSVQGVLARNVPDLKLAFGAISKPDICDPWSVSALMPPRMVRQVAVCRVVDGYTIDPEVSTTMEEVALRLQSLDYEVTEISPPLFREAAELWISLNMNEARITMLASVHQLGDARIRKAFDGMLSLASPFTLDQYISALSTRTRLARLWSAFLAKFPVLVMPVSWLRPFPAELDQSEHFSMRHMVDAQSPLLATAILGLPGLSVPIRFKDNTPYGVQLIADRFHEASLFDVAHALETCGHPSSTLQSSNQKNIGG